MGFKDLKLFNLALLAKQRWWVLTHTFSLVHQTLKEKYFHHSSLLEAKLGPSPSYTWKGIFESIPTIKQGMRWKVGDGKAIELWSDYWLSGQNILRHYQPLGEISRAAKTLSTIILSSSKVFFLPLLACTILKPIISSEPRDDALFWEVEKISHYIVQSAYRILTQLGNESGGGANSNNLSSRKIWMKLWCRSIPNKLWVFAWLCGRDSLPIKQNLSTNESWMTGDVLSTMKRLKTRPMPFLTTHK